MLTDKEIAANNELNDDQKKAAVKHHLHRAHRAINDGSLDRDTANNALANIAHLTVPETIVEATPGPLHEGATGA